MIILYCNAIFPLHIATYIALIILENYVYLVSEIGITCKLTNTVCSKMTLTSVECDSQRIKSLIYSPSEQVSFF